MIYYCTEGSRDNFEPLPNSSTYEIDSLTALECVDDLYCNHDGWEYTWPVVIGLSSTPDGPAEKWFEVELEMTPSFSAVPTEVEEEEMKGTGDE